MTTNNLVIDHLRQQWDEYRRTADMLEGELNAVKAKMNFYQKVLADLNSKPDSASGGTGIHATIRPSQFMHYKTQRGNSSESRGNEQLTAGGERI